jgi:cell wall-associated NlpC family hydrolase
MNKPILALVLALSASVSLAGGSGPAAAQRSAVPGSRVVAIAQHYLGYPFTRNGAAPTQGFNDIGFVRFVYRAAGLALPSSRRGMLRAGSRIAMADLQPGDLVFFRNTLWTGLSHVGIYVGGGRFIHAEWYRMGVRITSFTNDPTDGDYWSSKYLAASRPAGTT